MVRVRTECCHGFTSLTVVLVTRCKSRLFACLAMKPSTAKCSRRYLILPLSSKPAALSVMGAGANPYPLRPALTGLNNWQMRQRLQAVLGFCFQALRWMLQGGAFDVRHLARRL
jgi:hypothetical protein